MKARTRFPWHAGESSSKNQRQSSWPTLVNYPHHCTQNQIVLLWIHTWLGYQIQILVQDWESKHRPEFPNSTDEELCFYLHLLSVAIVILFFKSIFSFPLIIIYHSFYSPRLWIGNFPLMRKNKNNCYLFGNHFYSNLHQVNVAGTVPIPLQRWIFRSHSWDTNQCSQASQTAWHHLALN